MFIAYCESALECNVSDHVYPESSEPIVMRLGAFGVHMTRDEALKLMSQLEKAIHATA